MKQLWLLAFLCSALSADDLPAPRVSIREKGAWRFVSANGLPAHATGEFPNPDDPHRIEPRRLEFRVTLHPVLGAITPCDDRPWGVAVNGVLFDPSAEKRLKVTRRSAWHYDAFGPTVRLGLDNNRAHVGPHGVYHYHGLPQGLIDELGEGESMRRLGWAADGFPVYGLYAYKQADVPRSDLRKMHSSYRLKTGKRPAKAGGSYDGDLVEDFEYVAGSGDLDQCNGRTGVTPEYPKGTYYYVLTETFPFIPRCWRGLPDDSFKHPPQAYSPAPSKFRRPGRARQLGGGPL